ncbi:multifunctional oxoglutarate decarboxylase/oxoglutarate dehydrogenase thiamine pyrophosphate-binding subunit/dihydrolipoyllysine-residue succinyltransferase subunit, partial [Streptomyces sp. NPDC127114]
MSSQSPSTPSSPADQDGQGVSPAAAFGANEWLVDEIYQQYLQDPNSVDRAWWDFFADYKPGASETPAAPAVAAPTTPSAPAAPQAGPAQAAPAAPAASVPAPAAPAASVPAPAAPAPAPAAPAPAKP